MNADNFTTEEYEVPYKGDFDKARIDSWGENW